MPKIMRLLFIILFFIALICLDAPLCNANSAEPPSIVIIVQNAPNDLEITFGPTYLPAGRRNEGTQISFYFYRLDLNSADNTLHVTTGGRTFDITIGTALKSYNNIFTLNLEKQTLISGTPLSRAIGSAFARVLLTLILEAIVFFLFGYRSKKSWLVFLFVNLFTQVVLNVILFGNYFRLNGYLIFSLIFGEILVFVIELIAFSLLVNEYSRSRTALYVITANLLSLALGGYLITLLSA